MKIYLGRYQYKTKVGFSTSHDIGASGILGQKGFFDNFVVSFHHKDNFIEIKKSGSYACLEIFIGISSLVFPSEIRFFSSVAS